MDSNSLIWSERIKLFSESNKQPMVPNSYLIRMLYHQQIVPAASKKLKMLDVGCCDGGNMIYFAKCGYQVSGVDIVKEEIELTANNLSKEGFVPNALKIVSNEKLDFPDNEFDFVLCWKTIYHTGSLEKMEKLLKEMVRVLKIGKALIINTLENDSLHILSEKIGKNLYRKSRGNGRFSYFFNFEDPNDFLCLLSKYGIDNVKIGSHSGHLLHKPGTDNRKIKRSFRIYYGEKVR